MPDKIKIKVMVVDDEEPARSELKFLLEQIADVQIIGECKSGEEAVIAAPTLNPQLIFMDVEMPGLCGIKAAEKIIAGEITPLFVFATAHEEFALKAFDLDAVDYLLKPISAKRVEKCIEKVRNLLSGTVACGAKRYDEEPVYAYSLQKIAIEHNGKASVIDTKDIVAAYCAEGQLTIHTASKCYHTNTSLQELHSRLDERLFFRTHRAFLVNVEKIKEIIPWFNGTYNITLSGYEGEIPVSRQQVPKLKKLFGL